MYFNNILSESWYIPTIFHIQLALKKWCLCSAVQGFELPLALVKDQRHRVGDVQGSWRSWFMRPKLMVNSWCKMMQFYPTSAYFRSKPIKSSLYKVWIAASHTEIVFLQPWVFLWFFLSHQGHSCGTSFTAFNVNFLSPQQCYPYMFKLNIPCIHHVSLEIGNGWRCLV